MSRALSRTRLGEVKVTFGTASRPDPGRLPILWEAKDTRDAILASGRRAILINERPSPGLETMFVDIVSAEDFAGGFVAAQYLRRTLTGRARLSILAGPRDDSRTLSRVAGFRSRCRASVFHSENWYEAGAEAVAPTLLKSRPAGVFCCNDRLAEGLIRVARRDGVGIPLIVGFDDAPISAALNFSTVAIPWQALAEAVARTARDRLSGQRYPAAHLAFYPELVLRGGP